MPDHLLDRTVSRRSLIRRAVALGAAVTALPLLQACSAPAAAPAAAPTVPAGVAPTAVAAADAASTQVAAVAPTIAAAGNAAATQVSAAVPTAMAAATAAAVAPTIAAAPTTAATTAPAPTVAPTAAAAPTTAAAATTGPAVAGGRIKIGFALQSLAQYRWKFDQQYIEARVAELGDEVVVQSANDDEKLQASQVENLLSQGIQVLILAPVNVDASATLVDAAAEANVPTISYNYVARNTDKLAYWVARDNKLVGHITAELALKQAPKGNYVICSGDAGADVAQDKTKGYMETLQPSIDKGDIKVVSQQYNRGWDPALGLKQVEDALTANNNEIAAVLCNYDGFALSSAAGATGAEARRQGVRRRRGRLPRRRPGDRRGAHGDERLYRSQADGDQGGRRRARARQRPAAGCRSDPEQRQEGHSRRVDLLVRGHQGHHVQVHQRDGLGRFREDLCQRSGRSTPQVLDPRGCCCSATPARTDRST